MVTLWRRLEPKANRNTDPCSANAYWIPVTLALLLSGSLLAQTHQPANRPQDTNSSPLTHEAIRGRHVRVASPEAQATPPVAPVLTIHADTTNPVPNQPVHFRLTSNVGLERRVFHFDWGDQQSFDTRQAAADHPYTTAGPHTVRVTAISQATSGIEPLTGELLINVRLLTLIPEPSRARVGENVKFTAILDPPDQSARYHFYFGDGADLDSGANQGTSHAYDRAGNLQARVVASVGANNETVPGNVIDLTIDPPLEPIVRRLKLHVDRNVAYVGEPVTFTAILEPPDESARYHFEFGDGGEADQNNNQIVHQYGRARDFHPSVALIGANGERLAGDTVYLAINAVSGPAHSRPKGSQPSGPRPPISVDGSSSLPWHYVLLVLGLALAVGLVWRLIAHPPSPPLRAVPHAVTGVHTVARVKLTGPHMSLMLKPGMDPSEDRIIFPESAAAD